MNAIPDELMERASDMFMSGATIRAVCRDLGIAKETAHRMQKWNKIVDVKISGKTRVNTGKRKDGTVSYYETGELRDHWKQQHYGNGDDL